MTRPTQNAARLTVLLRMVPGVAAGHDMMPRPAVLGVVVNRLSNVVGKISEARMPLARELGFRHGASDHFEGLDETQNRHANSIAL